MSAFLQKIKPRMKPLPDGVAAGSATALISTWFASGRCRPAPGTIGSLAAIPLGAVIGAAGGPIALCIAALALLWIGTKAAEQYGAKSGEKDDQSIVVDEVVGIWIAAIPAEGDLRLWLLAFLLFRFFDIVKIWPASFFDRRKKGAWDVMLDDVVAGLFALPVVATAALYAYL